MSRSFEPWRRARLMKGLSALAAAPFLPWSMTVTAASPSHAEPRIAVGEFDVAIGADEAMTVPTAAPAMARRRLDKHYRGDLQGHALGEMLSAGDPQAGAAGYAALESFTGTLHGRSGGFALVHLGLMQAGGRDLRISVVPGSGTGELAGISGDLALRIEAGRHRYTLTYRLD